MLRAERETPGVVFCLRSRTTGQSRPIIEFREVGRRHSVKLKPGLLPLLPSLLGRISRGLNIGNEALDSSEANLSELTNKDGRRSPNILDANTRCRDGRREFFNVPFSSLSRDQRLFFARKNLSRSFFGLIAPPLLSFSLSLSLLLLYFYFRDSILSLSL